MSSNTVRDRSGVGLPSKAERRALGKAAARKRAQARRRRQLRNRTLVVVVPLAVAGIIWGAVALSHRDNTTTPAADASTEPAVLQCDGIPADLQATLGTHPEVTAGEGTLTELKVTTLVTGTGRALTLDDQLCANYVGAYYNTGEVFQETWATDGSGSTTPVPFALQGVIAGWTQGLVGVPIGSRVLLDIPVDLAYQHQPGYPDGDLRFVVDVLDAVPAVPA